MNCRRLRGHPVFQLGAQPGSGKTKLRVNLQTDSEIIINTDELRWINPYYRQLLNDPESNALAGYLVNPDATDWSIRLRDEAIEERRNLIIDSTFGGSVQHFIDLFQRLNKHGYVIELHIIGVNPFVSRLGIYYRFERNRSTGNSERMVSMEVHDTNYRNLPKNLLAIGKYCHEQVGKVVIYSRDGSDRVNINYQTECPCDFDEALRQLTYIRERHLSAKEIEDFKSMVNQVKEMIELRGGDAKKFLNDVAFVN